MPRSTRPASSQFTPAWSPDQMWPGAMRLGCTSAPSTAQRRPPTPSTLKDDCQQRCDAETTADVQTPGRCQPHLQVTDERERTNVSRETVARRSRRHPASPGTDRTSTTRERSIVRSTVGGVQHVPSVPESPASWTTALARGPAPISARRPDPHPESRPHAAPSRAQICCADSLRTFSWPYTTKTDPLAPLPSPGPGRTLARPMGCNEPTGARQASSLAPRRASRVLPPHRSSTTVSIGKPAASQPQRCAGSPSLPTPTVSQS